MYLAGINYFISFHPDSIKMMKAKPEVIFTDFKIFNTSNSHLIFQNKIILQYDQNFFSVDFSAPYFSGGGTVRYSYMLEAVDKDWVDAGTKIQFRIPIFPAGITVLKCGQPQTREHGVIVMLPWK